MLEKNDLTVSKTLVQLDTSCWNRTTESVAWMEFLRYVSDLAKTTDRFEETHRQANSDREMGEPLWMVKQ